MKKRNLFVVCTVLLALSVGPLLAKGVEEQAPQAPQKAATLTIGVSQEAVGLDPHIVTAFSSMRRIDLLYSRLVRLDENMKVVPDLAESWEIPNNLTYIFHLKKGVKFHNGREMVASDVKYSLERVLDPATASPGRSYISSISKIDVLDDYTVKLTLSAPLASLLDALTSNNISIVPKEAVEANGNLQRVAVGTGPYMLKEWVVDNSMTLVKNPDYFEKGLPLTDTVIFRVIPEEASLYAGVKSGNLDLATINDGATIRQASADKSVVVMSKPGMNVRVFSFNNEKKPFDDVRVRQAVALALDRSEILTMAEYGMGAATGPIPISAKEWAIPPDQLPFGKPDYAKAKQLLAEAGYPNGFSFDIVCSSTYEGGLAVAQVIQNELKNIGLTANLDVVEWGNYIDRWVKRDFSTMVELRGGSSEPDRFLFRSLHSTGGVNNFMFKDAQTDKLLELGREQTVPAERKATYDELQRVLSEKVPLVFLYSPNENQVLSPYVKGFKQVGNGSLYYVTTAQVVK
ncbi:MAG: ABC transporter substrate-binding protein [Sphaerochaeta sp.]|jgi:peptide/nickel transport system substrate-binding protein|uniref:ABC transporter substrate-binding protein n=1 Tax=Sphaerochaeta sp. TaxID=1972642 RepID=UPI002FC8BE5F